jgi:hypothetical protein
MPNGDKLAERRAEAEREKIKSTTVAQATNLSQANINLIHVVKSTSEAQYNVVRAIGKISFANILSKETSGFGIFNVINPFRGEDKFKIEQIRNESLDVQNQYKNFVTDLLDLNKYLVGSGAGKIKLDGQALEKKMEKYFNSYNTYIESLTKLREKVEEYTINTKSDYVFAAIDAALAIGTLTGVGALAAGAGRAIASGAIKEGMKAGAKVLAKEAAGGAWKAVSNWKIVSFNTLFSAGTVGVEAWKQNDMDAALKKFQENPAEGIGSMDRFLLGAEKTVKGSGNKNAEQIMSIISNERIHLKEMEAKLKEPGGKLTFGEAARTFATTFALSMLFEAGFGAGGAMAKSAKAKTQKEPVAKAVGGEAAETRPLEALLADKAAISKDLKVAIETEKPHGRITAFDAIEDATGVFRVTVRGPDGKELSLIYRSRSFREEEFGSRVYDIAGERRPDFIVFGDGTAMQESVGIMDALKALQDMAMPQAERTAILRSSGRQGTIDFALGLPDGHAGNYRVIKKGDDVSVIRVDFENFGLGWGEGLRPDGKFSQRDHALFWDVPLKGYSPGSITAFVGGIDNGILAITKMDADAIGNAATRFIGTPLQRSQKGTAKIFFDGARANAMRERIALFQTEPVKARYDMLNGIFYPVREGINAGNPAIVEECLQILSKEVPGAPKELLEKWKSDFVNIGRTAKKPAMREVARKLDELVGKELARRER